MRGLTLEGKRLRYFQGVKEMREGQVTERRAGVNQDWEDLRKGRMCRFMSKQSIITPKLQVSVESLRFFIIWGLESLSWAVQGRVWPLETTSFIWVVLQSMDSPKSIILGMSPLPISIFWNLRSMWIIPQSLRNLIPCEMDPRMVILFRRDRMLLLFLTYVSTEDSAIRSIKIEVQYSYPSTQQYLPIFTLVFLSKALNILASFQQLILALGPINSFLIKCLSTETQLPQNLILVQALSSFMLVVQRIRLHSMLGDQKEILEQTPRRQLGILGNGQERRDQEYFWRLLTGVGRLFYLSLFELVVESMGLGLMFWNMALYPVLSTTLGRESMVTNSSILSFASKDYLPAINSSANSCNFLSPSDSSPSTPLSPQTSSTFPTDLLKYPITESIFQNTLLILDLKQVPTSGSLITDVVTTFDLN